MLRMSARKRIIVAFLFTAMFFALLPSRLSPPPDMTFNNDAYSYHQLAVNLLQNGGYSMDGVTPSAEREPGYSLLLAVIYLCFGPGNRLAIFLIQAVMHFFATMIFLSYFQKFAPRAAVNISLFFLMASPAVYHSIFTVNRESVSLSFFMLAIGLLLAFVNSSRNATLVAAGVVFGVLIITYLPFFLLIFPLIIIVCFLKKISKYKVILFLVLSLLPLSIWIGRNCLQNECSMGGCYRSALVWHVRAMQITYLKPLEPVGCLYHEYVTRRLSDMPLACRFWDAASTLPFSENDTVSLAQAAAAGKKIILNNPLYHLWISLFWAAEYHFPAFNGWGLLYNFLELFFSVLIYAGLCLFFVRLKKNWQPEYWLLLMPVIYGTVLFSLLDVVPRYRIPILFCYFTLSSLGYSHFLSVFRNKKA